MNEHEAARIAAAMNQLRPDWPTKQLRTLLADARISDRPRRDVAVALAWVACEAASHNPYRVLETGPWWIAAGVDGQTTGRREPFDPDHFCGICNKPNDPRHPDDHEFESATRDRIAATKVDEGRLSSRLQAMRESIGDARAIREPEPTPEPLPSNPRVDELRAVVRDQEEPAPHLSPDRRRPLCGDHVEHETELESA
jgi:hypothetical protein